MNVLFIILGVLFSLVLFVVFAFIAVTYTHYYLNKKANNSILILGNIYEFRYLSNENLIQELHYLNDDLNKFQIDFNEIELSNYYTYLDEYLFKKYIYPKLLKRYCYYLEDNPNLKDNNSKIYFSCIG